MNISKEAEEAAQLEIAANYLRTQNLPWQAKIGEFVQKAIDKALEDYRIATSRG